MGRSSGAVRAVSLAGLAAAGLVGGHSLGYALAVPDVHHRTTLVAQTGHGYIPSASWVAVVLGLAAVVAGVAAGYLRKRNVDGGETYGWVAARLVPLQAGAFVLLEVVERALSGASMGTLAPRLLTVGILAQVLVALIGALLFAGLSRLGRAIADPPRLLVPQVVSEPVCDVIHAARGERTSGHLRVRAPPSSRAA